MDQSTAVPALSLQDVSVAYDAQTVLSRLSFAIAPGEFVGVIGPNGAGKSTLLNALLGTLPLRAGQVLIHGQPVSRARGRLAYMPQREAVDWSFPVVVEDVVLMGRQNRLGFGRRPGATDRAAVSRALAQMQMLDRRKTPIGSLSGGQQQRVFLARALAQEGDVLLLDEPMTGVDSTTQEAMLRLLQGFQREGRTIVMTTHDLALARAYCSRVLFINRVLVAYGAPSDCFTPAVLRATYGGAHMLRLGADDAALGVLDDALFVLQDEGCCGGAARQGAR